MGELFLLMGGILKQPRERSLYEEEEKEIFDLAVAAELMYFEETWILL